VGDHLHARLPRLEPDEDERAPRSTAEEPIVPNPSSRQGAGPAREAALRAEPARNHSIWVWL
jgi:hypothetical protein